MTDEELVEALRARTVNPSPDPDALRRVVSSHGDPAIRRHALLLLMSGHARPVWLQEALAEAALRDASQSVRELAVRDLTDQEALREVATKDPALAVRRAAALRVSDEATLKHIAFDDPEARVRSGALANVSDQDFVARMLDAQEPIEVRTAAARRLRDEARLLRILEHESQGQAPTMLTAAALAALDGLATTEDEHRRVVDLIHRYSAFEIETTWPEDDRLLWEEVYWIHENWR